MHSRTSIRHYFFAVLVSLVALTSYALPPNDTHKHLGVASCAGSQCHGKIEAQSGQNVFLNEYRTWSADDRHSRAYQTLLSDESKRIAAKLGLPSAHTAKICLDCHADNVAAAQRGPKFQLDDGIGCETCHGGAEKWIETHTDPLATHAANVEAGLYPAERASERAAMCLSCHMGNKDQFATHRIMGAGHPRLSFELENFTANQPAHYQIDDDYKKRKNPAASVNLWVGGQIALASRFLELLQSPQFATHGMMPEFSFYDCHSCHHAMKDTRWQTTSTTRGIEPGTLRLNESAFAMLRAITQVVAAGDEPQLTTSVAALIGAAQQGVPYTQKAAAALAQWLAARKIAWTDRTYSPAEAKSLRKAVVRLAADGQLRDFSSAEQVYMACESLSLFIGDDAQLQPVIDGLYNSVKNDGAYSPEKFITAAKTALQRL
jgi:hypothetical protein